MGSFTFKLKKTLKMFFLRNLMNSLKNLKKKYKKSDVSDMINKLFTDLDKNVHLEQNYAFYIKLFHHTYFEKEGSIYLYDIVRYIDIYLYTHI